MPDETLLAVPIVSASPPLAEQVRTAIAAGADLVELRVDLIGDVEAVAELLHRPHRLPFIVTIRTRDEGGGWDGDDDQRVALFERLGLLEPGLIDVELATWNRSANLRQKLGLVGEAAPGPSVLSRGPDHGGYAGAPSRRGTYRVKSRLILSHHDLRGTPVDLAAALAPLLNSSAEIIKAVFTARHAMDAWRVMEWLRCHGRARKVVALAMGEAGLLTRVLARKFGGFLTFATLQRGAESAPGQPTVGELLDTYRWRAVGRRTGVFGVVGWPVGHSRSPVVHNAAMAAAGIDGVFVPMPVGPTYGDFAAFMDYLTQHAELDVHGLSVTIPHKEHALRWLDENGGAVSRIARRAGAVNTLVRTRDESAAEPWGSSQGPDPAMNSAAQRLGAGPSSWSGDNTDVAGILAALRMVVVDAAGGDRATDAAVLGAGGAARAAVIGLLELGCRVTVFNRTPDRANALADELGCSWQPWERRGDSDAHILINCTSVGMQPHTEDTPLPAECLRPGMIVLDAVYTPARTRLLREAQLAGCRPVSGVEMFIGQAAAQFELWHGVAAPEAVIRGAIRSS